MEKKQTPVQEKFKTMIGGQALIEGILMRGPEKQAIVVRSQDGLVEKVEPLRANRKRCPVWGWPLIRGVVNFGGSMYSGVKALLFSADYYQGDEDLSDEPTKFERWIEKHFGTKAMEQFILVLAVVLGIGFSIGLFFLLPMLLSEFALAWIGSDFVRNLIEGVVRVAIFLGYMIAVSRLKDMKRVFSYHGAEHKVIHAFEAGGDVDAATAARMSRLHPRCGTTFLLFVISISIILHAVLVPLLLFIYCPEGAVAKQALTIVFKLLLMVPISALAYELIRYAARMPDGFMATLLRAPGLTLQRMTTAEPDERQLDVAVVALREALGAQAGDNIITAPYRRDA